MKVNGSHGQTHQKLQNETNTRIKFVGVGFGLRQKTNTGANHLVDNSDKLQKNSEKEKPYILILGDDEDKVNWALKKVADLIVASVGVKYRDRLWSDLQIMNPCLRIFTNGFRKYLKNKMKAAGITGNSSVNSRDQSPIPGQVTVLGDQSASISSSPIEGSFSPCNDSD